MLWGRNIPSSKTQKFWLRKSMGSFLVFRSLLLWWSVAWLTPISRSLLVCGERFEGSQPAPKDDRSPFHTQTLGCLSSGVTVVCGVGSALDRLWISNLPTYQSGESWNQGRLKVLRKHVGWPSIQVSPGLSGFSIWSSPAPRSNITVLGEWRKPTQELLENHFICSFLPCYIPLCPFPWWSLVLPVTWQSHWLREEPSFWHEVRRRPKWMAPHPPPPAMTAFIVNLVFNPRAYFPSLICFF